MIKGSIQKEDIIFINIYVPNIRAPTYIKQILTNINRQLYNNTIIVRNFSILLSSVNRLSR